MSHASLGGRGPPRLPVPHHSLSCPGRSFFSFVPSLFGECLLSLIEMVDPSVRASMKNAASCDT